MPMMPMFFILGYAGMSQWIRKVRPTTLPRVITRVWSGSMLGVMVVFWVFGAQAYARDVAVIESEMVSIAHWLNLNTPEDAVIAVHDIGAIGYFGNRDLVDLAGLISPDVIPFIRDEEQLGRYLDSQNASYLVTFPDWYPILVGQAALIYQTDGVISPVLGKENMAVYKWADP